MKNRAHGIGAFLVIWLVWVALWLAGVGAIIWVAAHFIRKYW